MTNNPLWYNLIETALLKGEIMTGLTIPYLIGAENTAGKKINDDSIYDLLIEIANSNTELKPVLKECSLIHQYVVGLNDREFCADNFKDEVIFQDENGIASLYVIGNAKKLGDTIEQISNNLKIEYQNELMDGKFSWDSEKAALQKFSSEEKESINNVILI